MFVLRGREALKARIRAQINRDAVARQVGIPLGTLGLWESRERIVVPDGKAQRLAGALG